MLKRDEILRITTELNRVIAQVLGLRQARRLDEGLAVVGAAAAGLAGLDLQLAARLGSAGLGQHLREPAKLAALARLMLLRADLAADGGDDLGADTWRGRAVELSLEAAGAGAALDDELRRLVDAWPAEGLTSRGQELRGRLGGG